MGKLLNLCVKTNFMIKSYKSYLKIESITLKSN